jgi:hypothetical protein
MSECECVGVIERTQDPNDNLDYVVDFEDVSRATAPPQPRYSAEYALSVPEWPRASNTRPPRPGGAARVSRVANRRWRHGIRWICRLDCPGGLDLEPDGHALELLPWTVDSGATSAGSERKRSRSLRSTCLVGRR